MSRLTRWRTAVAARLDQVVAQVENHEALAAAVLADVRRAAARAKVQLARVRSDGEGLRHELERRRREEARWRRRARRFAAEDEERALECLTRSRRAARPVPALEERLAAHHRLETRLAADLDRIEERLAALAARRNLMRTRQSRAEALAGTRDAEVAAGSDLAEVFERWETRITELELGAEPLCDADPLEAELDRAEERESLRRELDELRGEDDPRTGEGG